jgi:predicted porin
MKKLLYGSTALMAAGMLASGAEAADKIKVGVGGYFQAYGVYVDQDDGTGEPGANLRDHYLEREAEIIFNGKTTLDNGLEVGVQVQLEAESCGDQIDESFIWFEGGWGRVNIGSENSAPYLMFYGAPAQITGWGVTSPNHNAVSAGANNGLLGNGVILPVNLSGDSEKLTYFTPRIAGFQLGVSYTPDACEASNIAGGSQSAICGSQGSGPEPDNNNLGEIFEIGANYVQKFGAFNVAVSGSYGTANDETSTAFTEDPTEWHLGANVGWGGFTVGGSYIEHNDMNSIGGASAGNAGGKGIDSKDWTLGVRYATGPWGVGVSYGHREVDCDAAQAAAGGCGGATAAAGEDELDMIEVGGSYALGPGVDLTAGVQWVEIDGSEGVAASDNDALVVIFGTSLTF